ncbi:MAG: Type I Iterative PKS [Pycnora praestabilis]|nr:MAG: Type I Iterative PKS [Pycnora praestabilis]
MGIHGSVNANGFDSAYETSGSYGSTNGYETNANDDVNEVQESNGINGETNHGSDDINGVNAVHSTNGIGKEPQPYAEPIAIVGMAMRLPGKVNNTEAFWDLLIDKKDGRCRIPGDRYNVDSFYHPNSKSGTVKMHHGYFLEDADLRDLDPSFFSMTRKEAEKLDPQHRLLLEVVRECLENAGETKWRGKNVGCYVGVFGEDWQDLHAKDTQDFGMYRITGYGDFLLGNRVSYEYDFTGPSMTVKTGCSSSLLCLHLACRALLSGECTSAIVGGTNLIMSPTMTIAMTEQGVLSPTGSCKSFDAGADGYARGEAINALYVKKLSDAIRDGDPIRAVIRGSSTNDDGKTPGIAHPSSKSHEALIRQAYSVAGLPNYSETAFVECHGTGTAIGDPLETQAVASVFGNSGVYIGSVKPNVGHSEGASGITSVIKSVLALENKIIPPNVKFSKPHPKIPFEKANLQVPVEPKPWPKSRVERVSVNSFGIGGANAHVILDSAASFGIDSTPQGRNTASRFEILLFSGNHQDSLRRSIDNLSDYVKNNPSALSDLAYTLSVRREHLPHRAYSVTNGVQPLIISPFCKAGPVPQISFVFTGQGAQWAGMGKELMNEYPSFYEDIRTMDRHLARLPHPPSWKIEDELVKPQKISRLQAAEFSQPVCTAIQVSLVNLLQLWGVAPSAVVGHSSGEIAGAYACRAITLEEAISMAYYRGLVTKEQKRAGGMAAVGIGRADVSPYLIKGISIACENSPNSVTLSGDAEQLDVLLSTLKEDQPNIFVRRLHVEMAYHSYHMQEIGDNYQYLIEAQVKSQKPAVPFYSTVTGKRISGSGELGASYWRDNLESPVLFYTAVKAMLAEDTPNKLFLEIGPHSALAGPLRQIFKACESGALYVPTLVRGANCTEVILGTIGQLYRQAVPINFAAIKSDGVVLTNLPTYPWHHETKYWDESRLAKEWRLRKFPHHDVLGSRIAEGNDFEPTWRNMLRLDDVPWIRDHQISQDIIFPGAGYIAMAGEAIRQVSGTDDYTIRHIVISSAMVLHESEVTETLTHFRPSRLTTTLDSAWFDFSISSYNGTTWTKHCVGQARAGSEHELPLPSIETFAREVPSARWYSTMRKVGLNYGAAFQGLNKITADTNEQVAVASMSNRVGPHESSYQLHPSTMDFGIQLFSVAVSQGLPRRFGTLSVPTYIDELYACRPTSEMRMRVEATRTLRGIVTGDGMAVADGKVVFQVKGLKLSPLEDDAATKDPDPHAAVRLEWKPDIDFMNPKELIRPCKTARRAYRLVERLTVLCILETRHQLAPLVTDQDHLKRFRNWLGHRTDLAEQGKLELVEEAAYLATLDSKERLALIESTTKDVKTTEGSLVGEALLRIFEHSKGIFQGSIEPLELLLKDGLLTKLYDFADRWHCKDFFNLISHGNPNLKVLEIGAGTGGTSAIALDGLTSASGERMYSNYTYTDISSGFFIAAKERFKDVQNIEYAVLDITENPKEQGFEEGSYDLIIATNVLHATPEIRETLKNVRKLLQPHGRLLLQELCPTSKWINYIMGTLPGWWLGDVDNRVDEPYVSPERWDKELWSSGFAGADAIIYDDEAPYHTNVHIVASPLVKPLFDKRVTLLCDSIEITPLLRDIKASMAAEGYETQVCTLGQEPAAHQDVISLLDLEKPFFENISADKFYAFLGFVKKLQSAGMLWVTRSTQMRCEDPRYALVIGLARTIRSEWSVDMATLELDSVGYDAWSPLVKVFSKFQKRSKEFDLDPDFEYALSNGVLHVGRFHWISVTNELLEVSQEGLPKRLEIGKRGLLKTLQWVQQPRKNLVGDEVQIEIRAVGMNFKDVLIAMGIVDGHIIEGNGLGCECSGIIRQIGPEVKDMEVGDRVIVFAGGSYSTFLTTTSKLCAKMPDELSFEDGATMPCVYSTVIHSLLEVGMLEKAQTVLIQSACGGIGIAAIQISQMIGAEIFATVGNEEKVEYLRENFGIPRNRIFNSRNSSFLPEIMRETKGRGIDVVLNSLSGELLHASWKCVAEFGKMVEIGKRDFIGRGSLSMDIFEANRGFYGVDFAQICAERPAMTKRVLERCMHLCRQGKIQPIHPMKIFEAFQIEEAFRFMQRGQHIGKIVVKMPETPQELPVAAIAKKLLLRSDVSYLMIGGLGGLGQSISTWMAENGARHLIYLSRSAGKSKADESLFHELNAQGCSAQVFAGSVSVMEDVQNVVKNAAKPIAGVIQMSMVLRDRALPQMTHEDWEAAISPKVQGTWNLHSALSSEKLDFFVLFSSFSGIVGQWGQANYAAANTFLDAFAQYRHRQGLPASVLDIGAMEDVGYVSQNQQILDQFKSTAVHVLHEQELLDSLKMVMTQPSPPLPPFSTTVNGFVNPCQVGIGLRSTMPISAPNNRSIWKRDIRMSLYRNLENADASSDVATNEGLKQFLSDIASDPSLVNARSSIDFLAHEIGTTLIGFMLQPEEDLDVTQSPKALGVDSLVSIELRNWFRQKLGLEITVLEILNAVSVVALGKMAVEGLRVKYGGANINTGETFLLMKAP